MCIYVLSVFRSVCIVYNKYLACLYIVSPALWIRQSQPRCCSSVSLHIVHINGLLIIKVVITYSLILGRGCLSRYGFFLKFPMILFSQGVSYSGFLWDSSSGVDLRDAALLEPPVVNGNGNNTSPRHYLAHFSVSNDWFPKQTVAFSVFSLLSSLLLWGFFSLLKAYK